MADIFFQSEVKNLLNKKHIVFFGDSNTRSVYKDVVWLLNHNSLVRYQDLKKKLESSFSGDKLGRHTQLVRGRDYEEERSYKTENVRVDFYFITKCYAAALIDLMEDIHLGTKEAPDVLYINSTFWDVCSRGAVAGRGRRRRRRRRRHEHGRRAAAASLPAGQGPRLRATAAHRHAHSRAERRWDPNGVTLFKENVQKLARLFKSSLPSSTLVIWATALPVSHKINSDKRPFDVLEMNQFACQVMANHGFDVLDNHFHMRMQIHRRVKDGVHYTPAAIRLLSNLLFTHLALSWDFPLPNRVQTILLEKAKRLSAPDKSTAAVQLPVTPNALRIKESQSPSPPPPEHHPAREHHVPGGSKERNQKLHSTKPYQRPIPSRAQPKSNRPGPSNRGAMWSAEGGRRTDPLFDAHSRPRTGDFGCPNFNNYPANPPIPVRQCDEPFYQDISWNSGPIDSRYEWQISYQRSGQNYPRY